MHVKFDHQPGHRNKQRVQNRFQNHSSQDIRNENQTQHPFLVVLNTLNQTQSTSIRPLKVQSRKFSQQPVQPHH